MITRYEFMKDSVEQATDGTYYPDPLTFTTKRFRFTEYPVTYYLTQYDIERVDILMHKLYKSQKYKDIVLDINRIEYIWNKSIRDRFVVPHRSDIETFIEDNVV